MGALIRAYPVTAFVLIAWVWTWTMVAPALAASRGLLDLRLGATFWEVLGALGPFIGALVMFRLVWGTEGLNRLWRGMLHWRVPPSWFAFSVLTPFLILLVALSWNRLSSGSWADFSRLSASELGTLTGILNVLLIKSLWQGLAEEPGWRGFMLPLLRERHGPLLATLILWPFWLLWHLPFFLARPEFGVGQFLGFSLGILSASIWLTLIWDATRSILMAILWHALINLTRFFALALSPALFLQFSLLVTVCAVPIVVWWLWPRQASQ